MEGGDGWRRKKNSLKWLDNNNEREEVDHEDHHHQMDHATKKHYPSIPPHPQTPIEFLSRSWSLSASQISKALSHHNHNHNNNNNYPPPFHLDNNNNKTQQQQQVLVASETLVTPIFYSSKNMKLNNISTPVKRTNSLGRWFHHKHAPGNATMKKKDKARAENARLHTAISIVGLATALAAVAAADDNRSATKMSAAIASATELLASHCIEMAESGGAHHDRLASAVRSAVDVRLPSDLMTHTAAAATALRAEATLKARLPKEAAKKNATINPYNDKPMADSDKINSEMGEHPYPFCKGDLEYHNRKGSLRRKQVSMYINKKSQVMIKMKNKYAGGTLTKKNKSVVYGVCDETNAWPFKQEKENIETFFGVKTSQGLLEFKCKNKNQKQKWVDGIQTLLNFVSIEDVDSSLKLLNII